MKRPEEVVEKTEIAIELAALEIKSKEKKSHKKTIVHPKGYEPMEHDCCSELAVELAEGKKSPMLLSPVMNRKKDRREAVSEKNVTERSLVKQSLKKLIQDDNISKYDIL